MSGMFSGISLEAGHTRNTSIGLRRWVRTYPSSSIDLYILHMKPRWCAIVGYALVGVCFNSASTHHMLDMFHVCYEVTSVNTAELRSAMCNGDQWNTGKSVDHGLVMERSVAGAAEQSSIKENKGKTAISLHYSRAHVHHQEGPHKHWTLAWGIATETQ